MSRLEVLFSKIIDLRWYILLLFGLVVVLGSWCLFKVKIDAIPDITNKQVIINTKTGSMDPTQIEKSITYIIESELYGIPELIEMRSISKFGLSQVTLIFSDEIDIYFARNLVLQRLAGLAKDLPQGISPTIAPLTTGIGEILIYRVYNPNNSSENYQTLSELRTIQEYNFAREIKKIRGVAEVDTIGGYVRELHLNLQSGRILNYGMTPEKLIEQVTNLGEIFGGGYIEKDDKQTIIRTYPNIQNYKDIMNIPVKIDYLGRPILLKEVVEVRQDYSQRLGLATHNSQETVLGTVLLQSDSNAKEVLSNVKKVIKELNKQNPDAKIEILYDRDFLISSTAKTVMKNLAEGILLVVGVLCLLIGSIKTGMIVATCLPFCIFILAICMKLFGISANLMSLGAIDFGLIVDASVVVVECIIANISLYDFKQGRKLGIAKITASIAKPITLGVGILVLVYVPILMFSGIEGKTFRPMALNVIITLIASLLVTFLLMPILSYFFIQNSPHKQNKIIDFLSCKYAKILKITLQHPKVIIWSCFGFFVLVMVLLTRIPSDFLPDLNEGDIVYTLVTSDSTSLSKTAEIVKEIEGQIMQDKHVDKVFSRVGTGEAALDVMPQNSADIFVILKQPYKKYAPKISANIYNMLTNRYSDFSIAENQPIKMRFNEMLEGSRADISLKIFGNDLHELMNITEKMTLMLKNDPNIKNVEGDFVNSIRHGPILDIVPDYQQIAKHQVTISEVNRNFTNSMGGMRVGSLYFSEFPIPILVHIDEMVRNKTNTINNIQVSLPDGGSFPISNVAKISEKDGIISIPRLFGKRYSSISIYLKNTNYLRFINNTEKKIIESNLMPADYHIKWGGRFENLVSAKKQIFISIPLILLIIAYLLYKMFGSFAEVGIIFSGVPFGISGGIILLFICQIPITISVYIGFIALIGISLLNSIILLDTIKKTNQLQEACISRLRPILMTALVASVGFLPMAFGGGIGSEVQRPIAITVIGGIISSTIATLILIPLILQQYRQKLLSKSNKILDKK